MEKNEGGQLVRALGLKESISMTIGTVVGVGLFTCGSSQIGYVGSGIIVITFLSLLISIWPCLIYGEMSAALPCAGGTYNYAKRGLNRAGITSFPWSASARARHWHFPIILKFCSENSASISREWILGSLRLCWFCFS